MHIIGKRGECIVTLNTAELLIRRRLGSEAAAPFLAHSDLSEQDRTKFSNAFKAFLHGDASLIVEALRRWPLTSVWNFANALSHDYGEDGHAVYAVLERAFGVSIVVEVRNSISASFRFVCRKHGLCYKGSGRLVDDYLAQAGIAHPQLHHVAKAFLLAERAYGPPPYENTMALNSWEDDATSFLPFGVEIPRMVLEVDQTAYYALLFSQYGQKADVRNEFERLFFEEVSKARDAIAGGRHSPQAVPKPALIWTQNGPALSLPKVEGRISVTVGDKSLKLRGAQQWQLPTPWPPHIDWRVGQHADRLFVMPSERHLLAFEAEFGRLAGQLDTARESSAVIDAREIVLVAAKPFTVAGESAFQIGHGYASHCALGASDVHIELEAKTIRLSAKPKPRLWIEKGAVAKGPKCYLISSAASFGVEFGELPSDDLALALYYGDREKIEPVVACPETGYAYCSLADIGVSAAEMIPVKAELRLRGGNRALVRYKAWLWPGLKELKDGLIFDCDTIPRNYAPELSRHVGTDGGGRLCLDVEAAYDTATLVFLVGHERVEFAIPRPGVTLSLTDVEGHTAPLKLGEKLIVRDEDKGGSLRIRCPDPRAILNVRGRLETHAFERSSTRVLSLVDLASSAPRDEITLQQSGIASVPILLTQIVPAACPKAFSLERVRGSVALHLETEVRIDAIRFSLEDDNGHREEFDWALGHRPVPLSAPAWLSATLDFENFYRTIVTLDLRAFDGELSLINISVRPVDSDSFRPLRNLRGDHYALVLGPTTPLGEPEVVSSADARQKFIVLNEWLSQCFSQESWDFIGNRILPRWTALGRGLSGTLEGSALLLSCAHPPQQPGTPRSWVPLTHPLQIIPELYGAQAESFRALAVDGGDGADHLALLGEISGRSIRDVHSVIGVSPAFLMAFENFGRARDTGEALSHFDFETYVRWFSHPHFCSDLGARWFWQPGDELLGPPHYGAAIGRLIDRLYDAGLDEDGSNDGRIRAAATLAHAASRLKADTLPIPADIEITHDIFEFVPAFISGFARASRQAAAEEYLRALAERLDRPYGAVVSYASFLIRLAPELLAFYLLLWELAFGGRRTI